MKLNIEMWKEFEFGKLISQIYKSHAYTVDELVISQEDDAIRYITRTSENNGCEFRAKKENLDFIERGNAITIGDTTATCFYQPEQFVTGDHMVVVRADWMNEAIATFLVTILNRERYRYSYGRAFLMERIKKTVIKLPILCDDKGNTFIDGEKKYSEAGYVPDWEWIERYIKSLRCKPLTTKVKNIKKMDLGIEQWKEFVFTDIFELRGGFYNKKPEHSIDGKVPFLASTESNNGVTEYYSIDDILMWDKVGNEDNSLDKKMYKGNCIAVTVNGSVCNAFFQIEDFTCSHDITVFYLKGYCLNVYLAMFLCTIIMQDKYRWSYGRKPHDVKKFGKSIIKLPVICNEDGTIYIDKKRRYSKEGYVPDWKLMETYIKSLPFSDRLEDTR